MTSFLNHLRPLPNVDELSKRFQQACQPHDRLGLLSVEFEVQILLDEIAYLRRLKELPSDYPNRVSNAILHSLIYLRVEILFILARFVIKIGQIQEYISMLERDRRNKYVIRPLTLALKVKTGNDDAAVFSGDNFQMLFAMDILKHDFNPVALYKTDFTTEDKSSYADSHFTFVHVTNDLLTRTTTVHIPDVTTFCRSEPLPLMPNRTKVYISYKEKDPTILSGVLFSDYDAFVDKFEELKGRS